VDAHTSAADAAPDATFDMTGGNGREPQRLRGLLAEAQSAVSSSANVLRDVRERYRMGHTEEVGRWEQLKTQVAEQNGTAASETRRDEAMAAQTVGTERATLGRIDLALKSLENAWLFLDPDDASLVMDPEDATSLADVQMRIVEAQEAERNRLAREVHDGPAQALSNAIFQIEVVDRLLDRDEGLARSELKGLRDMLTRELRGVRAYLSQLRPPLLADLGLVGAIREAAEQIAAVLGIPVTVELDEEIDGLPEPVEIVILRVIQEALQNVRKHANPSSVRVRVARDGTAWAAEIRDDGKGFDPYELQPGGRRHFGLQFMRERADLIGAIFEVRSRPELGTVVRLVIPNATEESR
jgi:signal transduction histidine kinase